LPKKSKPCKLGTGYVEWIHDHLISGLYPDVDPVSEKEYRSVELLQSALARPFASAGEQDAYPSLIEKAAALFHSLISNHPFTNGNKRVAVVAVDAFLLGNGYTLALDNEQMYELARTTASYRERGITHEQSFQEIRETLQRFSVPLALFYREQKKHSGLSGFYKTMITIRKSVRQHPCNRLIPV
jgi:death-on-curing family protein